MTRFDAATADERTELFVDAIVAHDERASAFLTIEAATDDSAPDAEEDPVPWIQFGDGVLNLDCTEEELDRVNALLDEFAEFVVDELERPEEAEGVNLRIAARTDPERVADFADRVFVDVYECAPDYRAWVTAV